MSDLTYPAEAGQPAPDAFLLRKLSFLLRTGIFLHRQDALISYDERDSANPLKSSEDLRLRLCGGAAAQEFPFLMMEEFHVCFAAIGCGEDTLLIGPMSTEDFNRPRRHQFYQKYGILRANERDLPRFTLYEAASVVSTVTRAVCGSEYTEKELLSANHLLELSEEDPRKQFLYTIREDDEDYYRHTYQEERMLLAQVREGNVEEAVRLSEVLDLEIGRLAENQQDHWRNVLVIGVTLCARAAIEGGVEPHLAYRVSGYYIRQGTGCRDGAQILAVRNQAVADLAGRVREVRSRRHVSSYTRQCKDYIEQHYREKILQEEVAAGLGISADYLSRLFKEETGLTFSEYLNQFRVERAANLLIYSEEPLAYIARYVNFPSQSYFGRIFKKVKGMTPRQYRELYKPSEFISQKEK